MKYATYIALVAAVAAEQSCNPDETNWTIYSDSDCKKVDKKLTKKYGHLSKKDAHMFSGDCENSTYKKQEHSVVVHCDADGFHEKVWKGHNCKGKPVANINYEWDTCQKVVGGMDNTWAKAHSSHDWDLTNLNTIRHGWDAWVQQHCVHMYEHFGYGGRVKKACLAPNTPSNTKVMQAGEFNGFNDVISSVKVGSKVKLTMYQHQVHGGRTDTYNNGFQGNVRFNDQYSSAKIVAADKAACIHEHFGQKGRQECFTYNESTGFTDYNLIPQHMNDMVSSISVPENVVVRMWQHTNRGGAMDEFWGPVTANVPKNDQYSHIRVCRHHC